MYAISELHSSKHFEVTRSQHFFERKMMEEYCCAITQAPGVEGGG